MAGWNGYTHYYTRGENNHHAFELDTCETCGGDIQAPNAISIHEPESKLIALGLKKVEFHPAETFYNEDTDMCACENCEL